MRSLPVQDLNERCKLNMSIFTHARYQKLQHSRSG